MLTMSVKSENMYALSKFAIILYQGRCGVGAGTVLRKSSCRSDSNYLIVSHIHEISFHLLPFVPYADLEDDATTSVKSEN